MGEILIYQHWKSEIETVMGFSTKCWIRIKVSLSPIVRLNCLTLYLKNLIIKMVLTMCQEMYLCKLERDILKIE